MNLYISKTPKHSKLKTETNNIDKIYKNLINKTSQLSMSNYLILIK